MERSLGAACSQMEEAVGAGVERMNAELARSSDLLSAMVQRTEMVRNAALYFALFLP